MKAYKDLSRDELRSLQTELQAQYDKLKESNIRLDMSRGKPGADQLDLSLPMLDVLSGSTSSFACADGTDLRNYGSLDGIPEAKELFADLMECPVDHVMVFGNSSLNIMYDLISRAMIHGIGGSTPWCRQEKIKFLCPVPGYDRHFAITESFGIEMINIPMDENGPDMDMVEQYVNNDPAVKGIWNVPKYTNPAGVVYSDEVVRRFANLKPAAPDFRIFWDNAYTIHHVYTDKKVEMLNIVKECEKAGNPDIYYELCSTSKVTFPGSGVAALVTSPANVAEVKKTLTLQTIGFDKINQMRHVLFFKNADGMKAHMDKHARILRPKFEAVLNCLEKELGGLEIGRWIKPLGGYFIAFDTIEGCAKRVVSLCKEVGVVMTPAGSTYPYKKDPTDTSIRIAPTFPTPDELRQACEVFVLCVKLASVEKYLENK
ncbi:MAG: aminotransferase class I/II-fold pyridoxal phosphate-dependent enzyme [Lachnospiraceae bacterium]|nr:aminotransferase class I/II-fold pyridoxal phosphate-dependent enzyme [Lachnospiraceae bacterium]